MLRYSLRTLLILLAVGPPLVAGGYWQWERYSMIQELRQMRLETGGVIFRPGPWEPVTFEEGLQMTESHTESP